MQLKCHLVMFNNLLIYFSFPLFVAIGALLLVSIVFNLWWLRILLKGGGLQTKAVYIGGLSFMLAIIGVTHLLASGYKRSILDSLPATVALPITIVLSAAILYGWLGCIWLVIRKISRHEPLSDLIGTSAIVIGMSLVIVLCFSAPVPILTFSL